MPPKKKRGYRDAVERIEEIVAELDDDRLDIDHLGEMVQEAADLIQLCKERLSSTEEKVGLVLKEMESLDDSSDKIDDSSNTDTDEEIPF